MLTELIREGGAVTWVIVGIGVLAFGVFVERALKLHRARIRADDFLKGIFNILARGNIREALAICDETPGPVAYVVRTAIMHRQAGREALRQAVEDAEETEVSRMERRLVVVATVGQIAPLLGLLGTVLALTECAILALAQYPLVQGADLLPSVLRALISTAAGLSVAIPCYAAFNILVIKIDRIVLDMQRAGREVAAYWAERAEQGQDRDE
jgi:biopolymer transport protein ExbB